jgi:hypothetical protein
MTLALVEMDPFTPSHRILIKAVQFIKGRRPQGYIQGGTEKTNH